MRIVDANVVLRYVLDDHEALSAEARRIIESQTVSVPIEVLCEVVFVLSGIYKAGRMDIGAQLSGFFENTACEIPHREAVLKGLELFAESGLDFVDCVLAGYGVAEGADVEAFDKRLQKLLDR
jgi:predicted nucleic-acid-binding protein